MATLYVTEQGAHLRLEQGRLLVQIDGATRTAVRLNELARVMLFGGIGVSSGALTACLDEGIDLVFLTLNGELRGRLVGTKRRHRAPAPHTRPARVAAADHRPGMVDAKPPQQPAPGLPLPGEPICALDAACQDCAGAAAAKAATTSTRCAARSTPPELLRRATPHGAGRAGLSWPRPAAAPDPVNLAQLGYSGSARS